MFISSLPVLASSGVYYAFTSSDLCGKAIVIFLLLGSIVAWSIMLEKWISIKRMGDNSSDFIRGFGKKRYFLMSINDAKKSVGPAASIYNAAMVKISEFHGASDAQLASMIQMGRKPDKALTEPQLAVIRAAVDKEMSDQIKILETRMGFLATCVSAAPFFGLFGTVWGVMLAFCSLAEKGRAEISALAPGVAGALLTTVAGLIVAIPSLIGYNLLTASITSQITDLEDFADQLLAQLKVEQTEYELEKPAAPAAPARQQQPVPQVQYQQPQQVVQQQAYTPPPQVQQQPQYQQPVQQPQVQQYQQPVQPVQRPLAQTVFVPNPAPASENDQSSVQPNLLNS